MYSPLIAEFDSYLDVLRRSVADGAKIDQELANLSLLSDNQRFDILRQYTKRIHAAVPKDKPKMIQTTIQDLERVKMIQDRIMGQMDKHVLSEVPRINIDVRGISRSIDVGDASFSTADDQISRLFREVKHSKEAILSTEQEIMREFKRLGIQTDIKTTVDTTIPERSFRLAQAAYEHRQMLQDTGKTVRAQIHDLTAMVSEMGRAEELEGLLSNYAVGTSETASTLRLGYLRSGRELYEAKELVGIAQGKIESTMTQQRASNLLEKGLALQTQQSAVSDGMDSFLKGVRDQQKAITRAMGSGLDTRIAFSEMGSLSGMTIKEALDNSMEVDLARLAVRARERAGSPYYEMLANSLDEHVTTVSETAAKLSDEASTEASKFVNKHPEVSRLKSYGKIAAVAAIAYFAVSAFRPEPKSIKTPRDSMAPGPDGEFLQDDGNSQYQIEYENSLIKSKKYSINIKGRDAGGLSPSRWAAIVNAHFDNLNYKFAQQNRHINDGTSDISDKHVDHVIDRILQ